MDNDIFVYAVNQNSPNFFFLGTVRIDDFDTASPSFVYLDTKAFLGNRRKIRIDRISDTRFILFTEISTGQIFMEIFDFTLEIVKLSEGTVSLLESGTTFHAISVIEIDDSSFYIVGYNHNNTKIMYIYHVSFTPGTPATITTVGTVNMYTSMLANSSSDYFRITSDRDGNRYIVAHKYEGVSTVLRISPSNVGTTDISNMEILYNPSSVTTARSLLIPYDTNRVFLVDRTNYYEYYNIANGFEVFSKTWNPAYADLTPYNHGFIEWEYGTIVPYSTAGISPAVNVYFNSLSYNEQEDTLYVSPRFVFTRTPMTLTVNSPVSHLRKKLFRDGSFLFRRGNDIVAVASTTVQPFRFLLWRIRIDENPKKRVDSLITMWQNPSGRNEGEDSMKISGITLAALGLISSLFSQQYPDTTIREKDKREIFCLAQNLYFESRNTSKSDRIAVANVVINRVKSTKYPNSICKVVWQRKQFSWTFDGKSDIPGRKNRIERKVWKDVLKLSIDIYVQYRNGTLKDITHGATHYHSKKVKPYWKNVMVMTYDSGFHLFYRKMKHRVPKPKPDSMQIVAAR